MEENKLQENVDDAKEISVNSAGEEENTQEMVESVSEKENTRAEKSKKEKKQKKENKKEAENIENLTDDELFAHIQTEKLLQRKKRQKWIVTASLGLAFVLAFVVIILAVVPVGLMPNCLNQNDLMTVTLYGKGTSQLTLKVGSNDDKDKLSAFDKYYQQSFSLPYLSALFSGSLIDYDIEENYASVDLSTLRGDSYAGSENYLVRFLFKNQHVLTKRNGSDYESRLSGGKWDGILRFNEAYFVVNKDEGLKDTKIFVLAEYHSVVNNEERTNMYLVTVTVKADTSKLFNAWSEVTK